MLFYSSGEEFATGVVGCDISPLHPDRESDNRIKLLVEVEDVQTEAIIDTGGIYCILNPAVADSIRFDPSESIGNGSVSIRGTPIRGSLYSSVLRIVAEDGLGLEQRVTALVPNVSPDEWGELPTFLELTGCLEFLRFAVDPTRNKFYFASV